jgi:hypothetical protein
VGYAWPPILGFGLDAVSRENIAAGLTSPKFAYEFKSETCRVENPQLPEAAIAYAERFLRDLYGKHGLIIETIVHGEWVEKDSFPIGKTKFGLASCADLALETFTFEQLNQKHRAVRD